MKVRESFASLMVVLPKGFVLYKKKKKINKKNNLHAKFVSQICKAPH